MAREMLKFYLNFLTFLFGCFPLKKYFFILHAFGKFLHSDQSDNRPAVNVATRNSVIFVHKI